MKQHKEVKISYWAAHLTTVVSVTLVLLLIGTIAMVSFGAEKETRRLKERLEVSMIMADTISNEYTRQISERITSLPFAHDVKYISKEAALQAWKKDTGEDLQALFGVNPLSPEIMFNVSADYASDPSLAKIETELKAIPGVEEVVLPDSMMVEAMNRNIESMALVLGIIALAMVVISIVLINNTVHLAIYARRFTIHTMQLVGATNSFIRTPLILSNMGAGLIAGLLASGILAIGLVWAPNMGFANVGDYISWPIFAAIGGALLVIGSLLCGFAAGIATTRYLKKDYEELFR